MIKIPRPRSVPGLFLWAVLGLAVLAVGFVIEQVLQLNVQTWAQARHYDSLLSNHWATIVQWLTEERFWLSVSTAFLVGGALCAWAYRGLVDWSVRQPVSRPNSELPATPLTSGEPEVAKPDKSVDQKRKATLWLERAEFSFSSSESHLIQGLLEIRVENVSMTDLDKFYLYIEGIEIDRARLRSVSRQLLLNEKTLRRGGVYPLFLLVRDFTKDEGTSPWRVVTEYGAGEAVPFGDFTLHLSFITFSKKTDCFLDVHLGTDRDVTCAVREQLVQSR